jgi:hypothetical protein
MFAQKAIETEKHARFREPLRRFVTRRAIRREQLGGRLAFTEAFLANGRACEN